MADIVDDLADLHRQATHERSHYYVAETAERAIKEVERLRIGQAVIVKQIGFYKPETPDFEFVRVPLGILRRAVRCDPPPYPEDRPAYTEAVPNKEQ